jgi:protoporphyrinogen oxidase
MTTNDAKPTAHIAVIGAGILGVTLAYKLVQAGLKVTVYERSADIGGLASALQYEGARIDRFYHTILSSDLAMQGLIEETGVNDKLHFTATKQGFYDGGKLYDFNTFVDLMTYPPLNFIQRFRLGLQIAYAQLESDWRNMETMPVEKWILRVSGEGVWRKVWKPLLRAKFDTLAAEIPATYIWSRLRRMLGTRKGVTSKEMMCYLENGYFTLIEAMAKVCQEKGVTFKLKTPIEKLAVTGGRVTGVTTAEGTDTYDAVITTLPSPLVAALVPDAPKAFLDKLNGQEYLSVLCPLLILNKELIPYYVLNITDESIPFTAVVETTNLIDAKYVKDFHLIYLPKYLAPDNEMFTWSDEQVKTEWMKHLKAMFPDFDESCISAFLVQRARWVEPLRPLGTTDQIPTINTPVDRLYMGNTVMIYPALNNGEAMTTLAGELVQKILADSKAW